ncbi:MAG: radical SAM family heme chaperone HemW [Muribaculaceae bacterium]
MAGIYIHIPFCKQKCIYCDFYSVGAIHKIDDYIIALTQELALRKKELNDEIIRTLYIGGGTPSVLSITQLDNLINRIKREICFSYIDEFTIEVNPDDITIEYAKGLKSLGINRVSMGIQSFNDKELGILKRRHTAKQAIEAIKVLKDAELSNISIDLIYGLPGQSIITWEDNVNQAIKLDVSHISAYGLSYEEGTQLYRMRANGEINECSEDDYIEMYNILVRNLKAFEYEHYEISNFAKRGKYSMHNSSYWNNTHYIGLGTAAHSYDGIARRYNPNNINKYIETLDKGMVYYEQVDENLYERYNDCIMTRLRTMWGLNIDVIKQEFGNDLYQYCVEAMKKYIKNGEIIKDGSIVHLSEKGVMTSDNIFRELFYVP